MFHNGTAVVVLVGDLSDYRWFGCSPWMRPRRPTVPLLQGTGLVHHQVTVSGDRCRSAYAEPWTSPRGGPALTACGDSTAPAAATHLSRSLLAHKASGAQCPDKTVDSSS